MVSMKNDVYHLVTVEDGKSDDAAILKVFSAIATGRLKCDLKLLNYYDEVPVSYGSTMISVNNDSVELAVHENQAVIMKHDMSTLIKSKHFHNKLGVHCYATYVNVPKKIVILHNFAYAQIRAERREAVRVKVRKKLSVKFSCESVNIEGCMVDISAIGISLNTDLGSATLTEQSGLLYFALNGTPLAVPGSFVRSITKESGGHICIFQMKPDRKSDSIIGQFIYQRQVEIIQLLKEGLVVE
jgi:hypothetical protein